MRRFLFRASIVAAALTYSSIGRAQDHEGGTSHSPESSLQSFDGNSLSQSALEDGHVAQSVPSSPSECCGDCWEFELIPFAWASGLHGDVTTRGRTVPVNLSFSELLEDLDGILEVQLSAHKGRWTYLFQTLYADLAPEEGLPLGRADVDLELLIIELGAAYRVTEGQFGDCPDQRFWIDVLGGARHWRIDSELRLNRIGVRVTDDESWWDPFVGLRAGAPISPELDAVLRADFGGFGIGEASKFTWNLVAGLEYKCTPCSKLALGYRVLDVDYERGSGRKKLELDVQLRGPFAALEFRF